MERMFLAVAFYPRARSRLTREALLLHKVLGRNGSEHVLVRVEDVEEPAIGGVHIEEQERSRRARILHMHVPGRFVGVIAGKTNPVLNLLALLDLDDVVFSLQHGRRCVDQMPMKMAIGIGLPAKQDVDVTVRARREDGGPVVYGIVKPVVSGEMDPVETARVKKLHALPPGQC